MLDLAVYPHILDAILHFAPTASLVVLRQTCRSLRERVRPLPFEHVLFLPDTPADAVLILTAASPHLYLGAITSAPGPSAYPLACPPELKHTRVLDYYSDGTILDLSALPMSRLRTLRRVHDDYSRGYLKDRHRFVRHLPAAPTVVDRVDLSGGLEPDDWSFPANIGTPYGAETHIIHLAFDLDDPQLPQARVIPYGEPRELVVVLHPYTHNREGERSTSEAQSCTRHGNAAGPPPSKNGADASDGLLDTHTVITELCETLEWPLASICQPTVVGLERLPLSLSGKWGVRAKALLGEADESERDTCSVDPADRKSKPQITGSHDGSIAREAKLMDATHDDNSGRDAQRSSTASLKFVAYSVWMAQYGHAPESMVEYYESAKMRRSRMAWESEIGSHQ